MSVEIKNLIILISVMVTCAAAPIYLVSSEAISGAVFAHPAVLINSAMEDNLPNELRNNFYKNANIAAGLAKESWFIDKEMQVIDRETDKIPRAKIYSVLHSAGFVRR
ncbi:hypothetical protein DMN91_002649 [Ooceraea biroi]|uniref:Uncharacterized protein n=1 Tax=Ooceraea biroi TaxID=2015173 RepID=A0A3L8DVN4_OOCBI|nr:uncharacterized protein LOC113561643 [Ooceraea biroi]RLU24560.1 hypothetical protein DMN91_002649 [Ooceraea biroi]